MKTPLRRRITVTALLLTAPAFAACSSGFGAQTDQPYQPSVGVNSHEGNVDILNAVIVTEGGETGTLSATLVSDDSADRLISVSSEEGPADSVGVPLPVAQVVDLSDEGRISVSGPKITPGEFVTITLEFRGGQVTELTVPVVDRAGEFEDVPMPAEPSETAAEPSASEPAEPTDEPTVTE